MERGKRMKITLINGSPRDDKSTRRLLEEAEAALAERGVDTAWITPHESLAELQVPYCTHCTPACRGECWEGTAVEDDYRLLAEADGVIVGSPVYFGTVSAPLKGFWDMTRKLRSQQDLLYTVGGALSVGGGRYGGQETTLRAVHDMMLVQGMIIVGDSARKSPGHMGAPAQAPARTDEHALERARSLAHAVVDVAEATQNLR